VKILPEVVYVGLELSCSDLIDDDVQLLPDDVRLDHGHTGSRRHQRQSNNNVASRQTTKKEDFTDVYCNKSSARGGSAVEGRDGASRAVQSQRGEDARRGTTMGGQVALCRRSGHSAGRQTTNSNDRFDFTMKREYQTRVLKV